MTQDLDLSEVDRAVAGLFGRDPASVSPSAEDLTAVRMFREAGFCQADAEEGARRLRSGNYFNFQDAALSMVSGFSGSSTRSPQATSRRIAEVARAQGGHQQIQERRTATQVRQRLLESATARSVGEAVYEACLIDVGEGSSGHYPAGTLQEAATSKVFHRGIHCYVDHPSASEEIDRPERSVKDLAGCLESDATYRDGGLWAKLRVFSSHRDFVSERAGVIGLSIRADGEMSEARAGKPTISRIAKVHSVDLVTRAGRGGRLAV